MNQMLGNEIGVPANKPVEEPDDPQSGDEGGRNGAVHVEAQPWEELLELRRELDEVRRHNDGLLLEKDAAAKSIHGLLKQINELENDTGGFDQRVRRAGPANQPDGNEPIFDSLGEWVQAWLLPLYRRELDGRSTTFCVHWWRHPEAYYRLDGLWKSWEYMRLKPGTGTAVWLKDYLDPQMAVLMSSNGPMHGCTLKKHSDNATEPWALSRLPTAGELAWIYQVTGDEAFTSADRFERIEAVPWDGKDQL